MALFCIKLRLIFIQCLDRKIWIFLAREYVTLCSNYLTEKQPISIYLSLMPLSCFLILGFSPLTYAEQPTEYRMKVAFLYNFAAYTEWPDRHIQNLNLCIYDENPFGEYLQHIQQKKINNEEIVIKHVRNIDDLTNCQMIFITRSAIGNLDHVINLLNGKPILTVADTPGTASKGIVLNMAVKEGKVTFEANIAKAKRSGLKLSSQLLRFASEIYQ
ncbi:MAG: YfiR family protein [Nitrosomonas sp.]|nr:YfiR family protein [Nitrosomonas sp.]